MRNRLNAWRYYKGPTDAHRNRALRRYYDIVSTEDGREELSQKRREYRRNNPHIVKAQKHKRRALKTNSIEHFTATEWLELCEKYANQCLCCGRDDLNLTADHVVPLSRGGSNGIDNIQPLCSHCNSSKWAKTVDYRY